MIAIDLRITGGLEGAQTRSLFNSGRDLSVLFTDGSAVIYCESIVCVHGAVHDNCSV